MSTGQGQACRALNWILLLSLAPRSSGRLESLAVLLGLMAPFSFAAKDWCVLGYRVSAGVC